MTKLKNQLGQQRNIITRLTDEANDAKDALNKLKVTKAELLTQYQNMKTKLTEG